jgi:hypothetical protein
MSRGSVVDVVTSWTTEGRVKNANGSISSTQSSVQWVPRAPCSGVKRQGREASAEVKKTHPLPRTTSWRSAYLVEHRGNCSF